VLQNGAIAHAAAFGLADLASSKPLDTHSVFNLASVSKQFTTFALLLLQQDGKLKLDDPVAKYVPEIAKSSQGVTLRHLVHHTGGLRDYIELLTMKGRGDADGATIHEAVQALGRQSAPNEKPGVEWDYSNSGYFLLGVVIARVSGQSLAQFSKERIFDPLGMKDTSIVDGYPEGIAALGRGYRREDRGFVIDETGWGQGGDGQVHSERGDLALWDEKF
jgi:CubicO group peptidase (beta-lactamase class C family)